MPYFRLLYSQRRAILVKSKTTDLSGTMDLMTRRMETGKQHGLDLNSRIYSDVLKKQLIYVFIYLAMQCKCKCKAMIGKTDIIYISLL